MKILIADDDPNDRKMLEAALSMWNYTVISSSDGKEAWNILQENDAPRIAVLDWMMPNMDGVELCKKIKERENARYIFVILLTSKSEKEEIVVGLDAGADDFITKPFDPGELKSRIMAGIRVLDYESKIVTMTEKRIALERELNDKRVELKGYEDVLGTFRNVAHVVNPPLDIIRMNADIVMKNSKKADPNYEPLKKIKEAALRISDFLESYCSNEN